MRNLALLKRKLLTLPTNTVCLTKDANDNFITMTSELSLYRMKDLIEVKHKQERSIIEICGMHMHPVEETILVALKSGELILYSFEGDSQVIEEDIGAFPGGIMAFSASPDNELVTIVTGNNLLILMLRSSLSVLGEWPLSDMVANVTKENVSVGWGKKETQFHGSVGKQAALTPVNIVEQLIPGDRRIPEITWRKDSAYFAVSFIRMGPVDEHREIVILDREGSVQAVKEQTEGLGHAMAWRTDGTLIAASQKDDKGNKVVFFERNGLQHGGFTLLDQENSILKLTWNCDGSILAVWMSNSRVDLWTCNNYHWYLKHQITFDNVTDTIWNLTDSMKVAILAEEKLYDYEFTWNVNKSSCDNNDSLSLVAVVDGCKLLLTPFAIANVPPPFSFYEIALEFVPSAIGIHVSQKVALIAVSYENEMLIYKVVVGDDKKMTHELLSTFKVECKLKQIAVNEARVYGVSVDGDLLEFDRDSNCIVQAGHVNVQTIVMKNDQVFIYNPDDGVFTSMDGEFCESIDSQNIHHLDTFMDNDSHVAVAISNDRKLHVCGNVVTDDCASFILHPEFLCYTNREGLVHFYQLSLPAMDWPNKAPKGEEGLRLSEGGAICIATVPKDASLILQMPRGNLEIVYPRAFVLSQVRKLLNATAYREAFLMCRRHRVDLNIMHDNNPDLFMSTLGKLVQALPETDYLNLIMSNLLTANVALTRYGGFLSQQEKVSMASNFPEKVNDVCDGLIGIFVELDASKYVECIMTAYVCRQPPNHEAALQAIIDLSQKSQASLERALKYLIFLAPAETLYRVALGMYHLPLALSVARRSQMDPSEYNEFLTELNSIDNEVFRKFRIDDYLQRYERALMNLVESGRPFEECLTFVKRHELYREAFKIYENSNDKDSWRSVCIAYAEYLLDKGSFSGAADLFVFAGENKRACQASITAGDWRKVLLYGEIGNRIVDCQNVISTLTKQKRYNEAVFLAESHVSGESAVQVAIQGQLWTDARRITKMHSLADNVLYAAVEGQKDFLTSELKDLDKEFSEKAGRLEVLQVQLNDALDPTKILAALESAAGADISDSMSVLSFRSGTTVGSQMSQLSRATSTKSRKKSEKQRKRAKPGSPYEREFLRDAIKDLITKFVSLTRSVEDLLHYMVEERMFHDARMIKKMMSDVSSKIRVFCTKMGPLIGIQESKMNAELLATLGLTPTSIPPTLLVDHAWRTSFDLPINFGIIPDLDYL